MNKLLISILRFILLALVLVLLAKYWFGINIPLFKKDSPNPATINRRIKLPEGFTLSLYAGDLPGARMLQATSRGDLLVSLPNRGQVVLLERDSDGDDLPDGRRILLTGLNKPHGIDLYQDWLYVAETDAIARIRFDAETGKTHGGYQRIVTGIPDGGHWTRTVRFGPDGLMYVAVGSSCNACIEKSSKRGAILRYRPDGSQGEIFATGLRNTVGLDWHPQTRALYGVDNGRDFLGDNFPPCELNLIQQGKFYGWPYSNGDRVPDPDFGKGNEDKIAGSVIPAHKFRPHNAPLGIKFLAGGNLPEAYQNAALVALHGSWNRSVKDGYKVVSLHFSNNNRIVERDFITGFEQNGDVIGRPVDIAQGTDGSLYISDDYSGSIYRVTYR